MHYPESPKVSTRQGKKPSIPQARALEFRLPATGTRAKPGEGKDVDKLEKWNNQLMIYYQRNFIEHSELFKI